MTRNKEENIVVDKLTGKWKEIYVFLCNNKDVAGLEPLSNFTGIVSRFKFDKAYNHPGKKVFAHHVNEWDIFSFPWQPCERTLCFEMEEKKAKISIIVKGKEGIVASEQSLILKEDEEGKCCGTLTRMTPNKTCEKYDFDISKHGYVKAQTFKRTSVKPLATKKAAKSVGGGEGK